MYTTHQSRGLRGNGTTFQAATQPVEGDNLATVDASSPAMLSLNAQRSGEILLDPVMAASAMQTVRPESSAECPPCPPPSVIYRDRWRDRIVPGPTVFVDKPVPGPTTTIYIDRATGQQVGVPAYTAAPSSVSYGAGSTYAVPPGAGHVSPEPAGAGAGLNTGSGAYSTYGDAGAAEGGKFPWWLLAAAVGAVWYLDKKKR